MKVVRLTWRPRVTKAKRAAVLKWIRQHYDSVVDHGDYLELHAPERSTQFMWIFMFSKAFTEIE